MIDFFEACKKGDIIKVNECIDSENFNIDFQDENGDTGLMITIYGSWNKKYVGIIEVIGALIKRGADLNIQNNKGQSALMIAVECRNSIIVEKLINSDANTKLKDKAGQNAYNYAVRYVDLNIEIIFLLYPKIINNRDHSGKSLLMIACENKNEKTILFLFEKGANMHLKNKDSLSALDALKSHNSLPEKLQVLMEKVILDKIVDYDLIDNDRTVSL